MNSSFIFKFKLDSEIKSVKSKYTFARANINIGKSHSLETALSIKIGSAYFELGKVNVELGKSHTNLFFPHCQTNQM